jgi:lipopolysaccharide transport protein LptA
MSKPSFIRKNIDAEGLVLRITGTSLLLIFLFLSVPFGITPVYAQKGNGAAPLFSDNKPIEITSERLTANNSSNTAIFEGSVVARQGMTTLYANWMKVIYSKKGDVKEIESKGKVKLVQKDKIITSEKAIYLRDEGKIIFTGNPVARDSKSTIYGSKMTYVIAEGQSTVENPRVILKKAE